VDGVVLAESVYLANLAARGAEKLAEQRAVEFAEATLTTARNPGDIVWYDSGRWTVELMVTESTRVNEGGTITYSAAIGDAPVTLKRAIRRSVPR
jgi:hypothetical protein